MFGIVFLRKKAALEEPSGAMELTLHGAGRRVPALRYFPDAEALEIELFRGLPGRRGDFIDSLTNVAEKVALPADPMTHPVESDLDDILLGRYVPPPVGTVKLPALVARDLEKPGPRAPGFAEFSDPGPGPDQGFLPDILGVVNIGHLVPDEGGENLLVPAHESGKGPAVAARGRFHQFLIRPRVIHRCPRSSPKTGWAGKRFARERENREMCGSRALPMVDSLPDTGFSSGGMS